jgi:hypothetical protein
MKKIGRYNWKIGIGYRKLGRSELGPPLGAIDIIVVLASAIVTVMYALEK